MRFCSVFIAMILSISAARGGEPSSTVGLADLVARLMMVRPHHKMRLDTAAGLSILNSERGNDSAGGNIVGVSILDDPLNVSIDISRPVNQLRSNRTGIFFRNQNRNIVFGQKISLGHQGYYILGFNARYRWIANIQLLDSNGRQSPLRLSGNPNSKLVFSDPLRGPDISLILNDIPLRTLPKAIEYAKIIVLDWPEDANAVLSDTDFAIPGNSAPPTSPGTSPFRVSYVLPNDFVDAECALAGPLTGQFSGDIRSFLSTVGLVQVIRESDDGKKTFVDYCTGTLIAVQNGKEGVLTANSCVHGRYGSGASYGSIAATRIFWDYRNSSCGPQPPLRWSPVQIADLPYSNLTALFAMDVTNDVAILTSEIPTGRASAGSERLSNPAELLRFSFHHSDLRPLLGGVQLRYSPADPTASPTGSVAVPPPCSSREAASFSYTLQPLDLGSSAQAGRGTGAPLIGQAGKVIGVSNTTCHDFFKNSAADFVVHGRIDAILPTTR